MHVFPAEIPEAEARRADVVEVRVARKVAPLFGLGGDVPPFRRSWVCDYTALSLAEIGRGAPNPHRAERSRFRAVSSPGHPSDAVPPGAQADGTDPGWRWMGRSVWSPQPGTLPGALSNATLNRYGPDTKAAAVLSAANRLLRNATDAVAAVCRHLAGVGCDHEIRLAVWAGLVLEVYRAQPALVVAAVQARQVQRSLSTRWGVQVDRAGVAGFDAPSEIHPPNATGDGDAARDGSPARWQPTSFDVVDTTLPLLGLADDPATGPGLVTADALDDIASAWCHRLLGIGRPGRGVVWMTEDEQGSRRVHAMVRVGAVVAPFVAATLGGTAVGDRMSPPKLPRLPSDAALAAAPVSHRRAHLLTAHLTANYVRYRDELLLDWPQLRPATRDLVARVVQRCGEILDADDPVSLQSRAYAAYLDVWDLPRTPRAMSIPPHAGDAVGGGDTYRTAAVRRLVATQQQVVRAWRSGLLDPGVVAYLLEIGIVALCDVASRGTGIGSVDPAGGAPTETTVESWWSAILEARGLDPNVDLDTRIDSLSDSQVFHLHHYAAWLARSGQRGDLLRALVVQERVAAVRVEVIRREPAGFAAKSAAARAGHERAAEIATDLALATSEREREARTRALEVAVRHARTVLVDPSTAGLLRSTSPQPATLRAARVVARALCTAMSDSVPVDARDAAAAVTLLDAAIGGVRPDERGPEATLLSTLRGWRAELARASAASTLDD